MDILTIAIILVEVAIIVFIANRLGKAIHAGVVYVFRRLTARTKFTTLDDYIIQYVEHPLRAAIIILAVLWMSSLIPNLTVVQTTLATYSIAILIVLATYTASEAVGAVLRWYYEESQVKQNSSFDLTLLPFVRKITRIIFITLGSVIALSTIGVEVSGLLAVTSVGVLILGLASQESLANIFAGLVLQLDRPAAYGDYVRTLNGDILRLQKIGSRSAKLIDLDGNLVVMSNSELAKQRLTNLSNLRAGFHTTFSAEIPSRIPIEKIEELITNIFHKESSKKNSAKGNPISIEKVSKEAYFISIPVVARDAESFVNIRDKINRELIELIRSQK